MAGPCMIAAPAVEDADAADPLALEDPDLEADDECEEEVV